MCHSGREDSYSRLASAVFTGISSMGKEVAR